MYSIFASELAGKEIVNVSGTVLGEVENMIFDTKTGAVLDLVIKPDPEAPRGRFRTEGKFMLIPFAAVMAVKDYIVVDENRSVPAPPAE
ncbi:MAG: photosystem reaction center subunit H [Methanosarcinales archaeon]|nr:photosystem reaction center subunit H [Methanosarcinales archaeon]